MRRISTTILALAAALALTAPGHAQTIGFKLGASLANWDVSDAEDVGLNSITGFAGGGFVRFGLGRLGIQAELLSITKGTEFDDTGTDDDGKVSLEYVEIPLLLHLPLMVGQSFAPYLIAGPSVAFEIGCDFKAEGIEIECDDPDGDIVERETTDFGLSVGGGLAFAMGPGAVLVEGRYTWGLTNLNSGTGPEIKNRNALLMAGYEIPLGRR